VIANFFRAIKEGDLRIHPIVGKETLKQMGAAPSNPKAGP